MIKIQINKKNKISLILILNIVLLPLFIIFSQEDQLAYAKTNSTYENNTSAGVLSSQVMVITNDLNVRETGDISSKIIGLVHKGDIFKTIQIKNNWDEIILSNNQTGWVYDAYITNAPSTATIEATVEANVLNVRKNPNLSSEVLGQLDLGTQLTIQLELDGWAKIKSSSGVQGWVYESYITKDRTSNDSATPTTSDTTIDVSKSSKNISDYKNIIDKASQTYNVPVPLIRSIIQVESNYNPYAVSSAGAEGIMQLMPEIVKEMGVSNPFDPYQNIMGGVHYLSNLLKEFKGNLVFSVAAYNAGPGNVEKYGGVPPFPETQNYVKKVLGSK